MLAFNLHLNLIAVFTKQYLRHLTSLTKYYVKSKSKILINNGYQKHYDCYMLFEHSGVCDKLKELFFNEDT